MSKLRLAFYGCLALTVLFFGDRIVAYVKNLQGENARLHSELVGQIKQYQQLSDHAAALEIKYSDEKAMEERLERDFATERGALQGRIKLLSNATFLIREKARDAGKSDFSYQGGALKYLVNEIRFNEGPPVGYVLIFDDGRVVSRVYDHVIDVKTAVSRDEDSGKYSVVSKADYVLKSPSINVNGEKVWTNKPYPLRIVGGSASVDPTEKNPNTRRLHWWAPHINGGVSAGAGLYGPALRPTVDFSVAGFGVSKNDLDWKILQVGVDVDLQFTDPGLHFIPFSYRFWPSVFTNTYVAPSVGWSLRGFNASANLNLTF